MLLTFKVHGVNHDPTQEERKASRQLTIGHDGIRPYGVDRHQH